MRKTRKKISYADLTQVLKIVDEQSLIKKTDNSVSFDIDLANPFLREEGLDSHIICYRPGAKKLLLNRESPTYGLNNLIFRNLDIDIELQLNWGKDSGWNLLQSIDWHFEHCRFKLSFSNMGTISLGWRGFFRFYKSEFDYGDSRVMANWLFLFESGSSVLFERNDFKNSGIQIACAVKESDSGVQKLSWEARHVFFVKDDSYHKAMIRKNHGLPETVRLYMPDASSGHIGLSSLSFLGNKGIDQLALRCNANYYGFRGMNCINHLRFNEFASNFQDLDSKIYFGSRERIDPHFRNPLHHRSLFLSIREFAGKKQDALLVNVLDKQLDRIEYFLMKKQEFSFYVDRKEWLEYWQDRLLYAWRRWSSDFYRSWLRPLTFLVFGYVGLNALSGLWIEELTVSDWIAFSLRGIDRIPFYTAGLKDLYGSTYDNLSPGSKNWLRLIGLFQVVWVALWGFALSKSIKR